MNLWKLAPQIIGSILFLLEFGVSPYTSHADGGAKPLLMYIRKQSDHCNGFEV